MILSKALSLTVPVNYYRLHGSTVTPGRVYHITCVDFMLRPSAINPEPYLYTAYYNGVSFSQNTAMQGTSKRKPIVDYPVVKP